MIAERDDESDPDDSPPVVDSNSPTPEEGHRLVRALLAIKNPERRRALIELAEALARAEP